jgi:hypothetical protein
MINDFLGLKYPPFDRVQSHDFCALAQSSAAATSSSVSHFIVLVFVFFFVASNCPNFTLTTVSLFFFGLIDRKNLRQL